MELSVLDYVVAAVSIGFAVAGLFIGFSGALGMLAGGVAAAVVGKLAWALSAGFLSEDWLRAIAVLVASLLSFGLVRLVVKKVAHGLVAQPADGILGAVTAFVVGFCLSAGGTWLFCQLGFCGELKSAILENVLRFVAA